MNEIRLRGKAFFPGLMAVLVSPTPIKVLCVFGTRSAMRDQFVECTNQVLRLGQGFTVRIMDGTITTPAGSVLMFRDISDPDYSHRLAGVEVHDVWVDPAYEISLEAWQRLQSRVRL